MKQKVVYVGLSADILHHGHARVLEEASNLGDVVIGLLTDKAIRGHKRVPYLNFEQRKEILMRIKGVVDVVAQDSWDYAGTLLKIKPDIMVHGDDWKSGPDSYLRESAIQALSTYGGTLIEIPHTPGINSSSILDSWSKLSSATSVRSSLLRRLLDSEPIVRIIEAHSPISAIIAENANVIVGETSKEFHGFWASSLTDSTQLGKPDNESVSISERLLSVDKIFDVTSKPLIFDADTGGKPEHFALNVKSMERIGISAAVIEDKSGLKYNSLLGTSPHQDIEDIDKFCQKLEAGSRARAALDFMIVARLESLILNLGMNDAINRACRYVEAGADAILIHSRKSTPVEVYEFAKKFKDLHPKVPLVCVPTTYNIVTDDELMNNGFDVVIYANHMFRAAYPGMRNVADSILRNGRSKEADEEIITIPQILNLMN